MNLDEVTPSEESKENKGHDPDAEIPFTPKFMPGAYCVVNENHSLTVRPMRDGKPWYGIVLARFPESRSGAKRGRSPVWRGFSDEQIATANLFASAPDLYTFLQKIYLDYEDDCGCRCDTETCCAVVGERCAKCYANRGLTLLDGPKEKK